MTDQPYWTLISILFSSLPMTAPLARDLHRTAYDLYRRDDGTSDIECGLASGQVHNLRKEMIVGTIAGPAFEATLANERGEGRVRFLLTRQGIELMSESREMTN